MVRGRTGQWFKDSRTSRLLTYLWGFFFYRFLYFPCKTFMWNKSVPKGLKAAQRKPVQNLFLFFQSRIFSFFTTTKGPARHFPHLSRSHSSVQRRLRQSIVSSTRRRGNVRFVTNQRDSLNNRIRPIRELATDAVISVDDDLVVPCSTLRFAIQRYAPGCTGSLTRYIS
jgi:hypothetical protein